MQAELNALRAGLDNPRRPVIALIGGAKVSTKISLLENLASKVEALVIGGAMANTFLHALGVGIGKSLAEKNMAETVRRIMDRATQARCAVILPIDATVAWVFEPHAMHRNYGLDAMDPTGMILDVGPQSIERIKGAVDEAGTLVWNGPLGAFETPPFDAGTVEIAKHIAARTHAGRLVSVAGGGDTVAALAHAGVKDDLTYVSTAGGAFLEWMEGKALPGVEALKNQPEIAAPKPRKPKIEPPKPVKAVAAKPQKAKAAAPKAEKPKAAGIKGQEGKAGGAEGARCGSQAPGIAARCAEECEVARRGTEGPENSCGTKDREDRKGRCKEGEAPLVKSSNRLSISGAGRSLHTAVEARHGIAQCGRTQARRAGQRYLGGRRIRRHDRQALRGHRTAGDPRDPPRLPRDAVPLDRCDAEVHLGCDPHRGDAAPVRRGRHAVPRDPQERRLHPRHQGRPRRFHDARLGRREDHRRPRWPPQPPEALRRSRRGLCEVARRDRDHPERADPQRHPRQRPRPRPLRRALPGGRHRAGGRARSAGRRRARRSHRSSAAKR